MKNIILLRRSAARAARLMPATCARQARRLNRHLAICAKLGAKL